MSISETLLWISYISLALAVISLIVAIFIWFKFEIPSVISDLSGRTAKKSIQKLRENNEKSGKKVFKSSTTNIQRGMLTDTMPDSEMLKADERESKKRAELKQQGSNRQDNKEFKRKQPVRETEETSLLVENENLEIGVLQTGVLTEDEQTEVFMTEETGLLVEENTAVSSEKVGFFADKKGVKLVMLEEIMFVHTEEVIH